MKSHDLARMLLDAPDLPIAFAAMGHMYASDCHLKTHGPIGIGIVETRFGPHIVVGNEHDTSGRNENFNISEVIFDGVKLVRDRQLY